jgi:hypothetical protein
MQADISLGNYLAVHGRRLYVHSGRTAALRFARLTPANRNNRSARYWPAADLVTHILAHPLNDCKWHEAEVQSLLFTVIQVPFDYARNWDIADMRIVSLRMPDLVKHLNPLW